LGQWVAQGQLVLSATPVPQLLARLVHKEFKETPDRLVHKVRQVQLELPALLGPLARQGQPELLGPQELPVLLALLVQMEQQEQLVPQGRMEPTVLTAAMVQQVRLEVTGQMEPLAQPDPLDQRDQQERLELQELMESQELLEQLVLRVVRVRRVGQDQPEIRVRLEPRDPMAPTE